MSLVVSCGEHAIRPCPIRPSFSTGMFPFFLFLFRATEPENQFSSSVRVNTQTKRL